MALKANILFKDLSAKELTFVQNILHLRKYQSGESVFKQGEVGVGMYIIVKGNVEIYLTDTKAASKDLQDVFITTLTEGDFFGELSLVEEDGIRTASAICKEECWLIGFFKPDLMEILERNPATGVKIVYRLAEVLGHRLKETTEKVSELRQALYEVRRPPPLERSGE